jgi:hypothetical protein
MHEDYCTDCGIHQVIFASAKCKKCYIKWMEGFITHMATVKVRMGAEI